MEWSAWSVVEAGGCFPSVLLDRETFEVKKILNVALSIFSRDV